MASVKKDREPIVERKPEPGAVAGGPQPERSLPDRVEH
jgi:hypothetical protein